MLITDLKSEQDIHHYFEDVICKSTSLSYAREYSIKNCGRVDFVFIDRASDGSEKVVEMIEFKTGTNFYHAIGQLLFYEFNYGHPVLKTIALPYNKFESLQVTVLDRYVNFMKNIEDTTGIRFMFCSVRSDRLIPLSHIIGVRSVYGTGGLP